MYCVIVFLHLVGCTYVYVPLNVAVPRWCSCTVDFNYVRVAVPRWRFFCRCSYLSYMYRYLDGAAITRAIYCTS
jgi:hypothetical protein